jgi:DNA-directed RNA polymerase specialized sigma subunit, sigma24 homolog
MVEVGDLSDRALWQQAREGDDSAFGVLFVRHAGRIYNYCFRRTGDWALAEDLTATTFLLAWRSRGRAPLQSDSALPLLFGIATNVLRNQRRSLRRRREAFARLPLERTEEPDFGDETSERLDDQVAMRELLRLVTRLPRREQDVIALCDWSGLSYEDAASPWTSDRHGSLAAGTRPSRLRELATANGPEADVDVVPLRIEVNER